MAISMFILVLGGDLTRFGSNKSPPGTVNTPERSSVLMSSLSIDAMSSLLLLFRNCSFCVVSGLFVSSSGDNILSEVLVDDHGRPNFASLLSSTFPSLLGRRAKIAKLIRANK